VSAPESVIVVETPSGPGHIVLAAPQSARGGRSVPRAVVVLGHGASGAWETADLVEMRDALVAAGCLVARSIQPYAVAGRRVPAPVAQLDAAFTALVAAARAEAPRGVPLVVGGRSNGARVAARTALGLGAAGLVALSFPLTPPGRPETSRAAELAGAGVPTLVVQGDRDGFGTPADVAAAVPGAELHTIPGAGHSPRRGSTLTAAAEAATRWILRHVGD
jgi:predicted alpha/beta-hydrolase family hydrolase